MNKKKKMNKVEMMKKYDDNRQVKYGYMIKKLKKKMYKMKIRNGG